jgi:23S rRNA pseudouridine1911/1915/1917 synthase
VSDFHIGEEHRGSRLDVVLADLLGESRSRAAVRIADGRVTVDGRVVGKNHRVTAGEHVEVAAAEVAASTNPAPPLPPVRYEDEHLLVVAKPAGLVVHPGHGNPDGTLVDALQAAGTPLAPAGGAERPGIVHRLDRDTSGLLAVAKTDEAHAGLVEQLRVRRVERRYLALVDGVPPRPRARIEAPIGRDPRDRLRFAVVATGREAVTRYEVLGEGHAQNADGISGEVSLLSCRLETGRTHQIRVHLASLGNPVSGDTTYRADVRLARALGLTRPFLHAAALTFDHPVTGTRVEVTEPLPADLRAAATIAGLEAVLPEGA